MIILDTNALIFDALAPERFSNAAVRAIEQSHANSDLGCSDISLWEIAMLISKHRLNPGTDTVSFLKLVLKSRGLRVLPINAEIAYLSTELGSDISGDPADRIIAATAIHHNAALVTRDKNLRDARLPVKVIW